MANVDFFKEVGTVKKYDDGNLVFAEGDPGSEMYIVLSGKVEIYIDSFKDNPIKVSEAKVGDFFGEMSILDDQNRSATAIALGSTVLLSINRNNFQTFISKQPMMAHKVMKGLSSRIRHLNEELAALKNPSSGIVLESAVKTEQPPAPGLKNEEIELKTKSSKTKSSVKNGDTKNSEIKNKDLEFFFPAGHKNYSMSAPEEYETFLFNKQVKCPVCGRKIDVKAIKNSKLKLERIEHDFRKIHVDFESLWYSIWICPDCYFSSFYYDFNSLSPKSLKLIKDANSEIQKLKEKISVKAPDPITIDFVFTCYYLCLYFANICNAEPIKLAKIWLQLSWLYKDAGDEEMFNIASLNALEHYHNAFYNSKLNITTEQEQQCSLIIGELYLIKGDEKEAIKHFHSAINRKTGSPALNQQAQDRIQEVKELFITSHEA